MESKSKVVQYGLVWAIISILSGILIYITGTAFFKSFWNLIIFLLLSIILGIVFMSLSATSERKQNNEFISFKDAFRAAFVPAVIAILAGFLFNVTLHNVIDKNYKNEIKKASLDMTEQMMEKFGADEATIEASIEAAEKKLEEKNQYGFIGLLKQSFNGLLMYAFFALIIAAIVKRKPQTEMLQ